jgi:hypothetical protein
MDPATLRGRRGIEWLRAAPAVARGWRLAIDKPSLMGTGEAMANIVADEAASVWGVLYELGEADFDHLELTEGVRIDHYQRIEIAVETAASWDGDASAKAFTFTSAHRDPALRPTTRYMRLLISGAAEHGLPAAWIDELRRIEAVEESAEVAAMRPIFDRGMKKPA